MDLGEGEKGKVLLEVALKTISLLSSFLLIHLTWKEGSVSQFSMFSYGEICFYSVGVWLIWSTTG